RGILAYLDSGTGGNVLPCTNNPFYQTNLLGFFQIRADINVLEMESTFFNVEVFAVDEPYISNSGSPVLVGVGSLPNNFNVCQEIVIDINTVAAVEALMVSPYIFFRVGSEGAPILSPPDPQMLPASARGVIDNISVCSLI